jgi:radical SAM superfamily enzyme YgiQ (UPF0313 family)
VIAYLRQTATNCYTLNALTGLLDACEVPWEVVPSAEALAYRLRRNSRSGRKALVLYSFMTPHLALVREELVGLGGARSRATFLAGGPHPSADPEGTLALGFDAVFPGEAERSLSAYLSAGAFGGGVFEDPEGGPAALDPYLPFGLGRLGPVELTRGCTGSCGFCAVGRKPVRHRSVPAVL